MKRLHFIACRVFLRELSAALATSPMIADVTYLPQGLHNTPAVLHTQISQAIEQIYDRHEKGEVALLPDAIVLLYGLCSNAVLGLGGGRLPLIVPRTDDCMALFLGSQKRYREAFEQRNGTYWLNNGWIEASRVPDASYMTEMRRVFTEKYGEDNADFLMEQELLWTKKYKACGFVRSPLYHDPAYEQRAKAFAAGYGWTYFSLPGDSRMIDCAAQGIFPEEDFLVCPPGCVVAPSYDESKICAQRAESLG